MQTDPYCRKSDFMSFSKEITSAYLLGKVYKLKRPVKLTELKGAVKSARGFCKIDLDLVVKVSKSVKKRRVKSSKIKKVLVKSPKK